MMTMAPPDSSALLSSSNNMNDQWLVRFQDKTLIVDFHQDYDAIAISPPAIIAAATACELLRKVALQTSWPQDRLEISYQSYPFCSVRAVSQIRGGKGGFGTLLKGQSRQSGAKLTTDFGACRDLQGRRLRHVNDEIKLRKWREAQTKILLGERDEKDNDYLTDTPSGIYNWHLMTPTWADISNKANNKMQRSLKRHFKEFASEDEKRAAKKKENEDRYHRSVDTYVRQSSQATESLQVSDAIQQGLAAKRKRGVEEDGDPPSKDVIITDEENGGRPNSLITLSGDLVVEVSADSWKLQSQSDFGTMAVVLEGGQANTVLYYEVHFETSGLHQIGWAAMKNFKPNTETGDGTGDDCASYAIDTSRLLKFHAGTDQAFGKTIVKVGDILGCLYDTKAKTLSYSLNGKDLGVAFTLTSQEPLVPAISVNQGEILDLWLQKEQMKYMPQGAIAVFELMEESQGTTAVVVTKNVIDAPPSLHQKHARRTSIHYNVPPSMLDSKESLKKRGKVTPKDEEPIDLDEIASIEQLMELGMDRLKGALIAIQCKGGGSLEERGKRLFELKGLDRKDYPQKVRAQNFAV